LLLLLQVTKHLLLVYPRRFRSDPSNPRPTLLQLPFQFFPAAARTHMPNTSRNCCADRLGWTPTACTFITTSMFARPFLLAAALMALVPSLGNAQAQRGPLVPHSDTMAVALISHDTVAAEQVDLVVRSRHREVQFCFEESGLKTDPELSGVFAMVLTLDTLGGVARVDASRREWSGPDGAAVEVCVMQRARTWKFPLQLAAAPARHEVTFHFAR
jgi:hypothetical protein